MRKSHHPNLAVREALTNLYNILSVRSEYLEVVVVYLDTLPFWEKAVINYGRIKFVDSHDLEEIEAWNEHNIRFLPTLKHYDVAIQKRLVDLTGTIIRCNKDNSLQSVFILAEDSGTLFRMRNGVPRPYDSTSETNIELLRTIPWFWRDHQQ
jgi:hypothetical protein